MVQIRFIMVLLLFSLVATPCHADFEYVKDYKKGIANEETKALAQAHLQGLGDGLVLVTIFEVVKDWPQLFCLPDGFTNEGDFYESVLNDYLEKSPGHDNIPLGAVLMQGLIEKYPCNYEIKCRKVK